MISGSTAFNNAVVEGGHSYDVRISTGGTVIDCEVFACSIHKGGTGSDEFSIGTVFVPYIELEVDSVSPTIENSEILLEIGVRVSASSTEWINIGYFKVTTVDYSTVKTKITAIGRIASVLSIIKPVISTPTTIVSIIGDIVTAVQEQYPTFNIITGFVDTGGGAINADLTGYNCRQLLEIITGLTGAYATEDNNGNVVLFNYDTSTTINYNGARMIAHPVVNLSDIVVDNVKVIKEEAYEYEEEETTIVVPEVAFQYNEATTPKWVLVNSLMADDIMFGKFCDNCIGLTYRPANITLAYGDPRIEGTDVLQITDINSDVYVVPCMGVTHVITGGLTSTIVAPGDTTAEYESSVQGPVTQKLDALTGSVASAQQSADLARGAANAAQADADRAKSAADAAQESADAAQADADAASALATQAKSSADSAQLQAGKATVYADSALTQLGVVEDVFGVFELLMHNGVYALTEDTEVQEGKWYFIQILTYTKTTDTELQDKTYYTVSATTVSSPTNDGLYTYYELIDGAYVKTIDTTVISGKTYYTLTGTVVSSPDVSDIGTYYELDTIYQVVRQPTGNPNTQGFYELTDISESIQNYVTSQLSLTNEGLWLQSPSISSKILLSSDGVTIYGKDGTIVGRYGQTAQIGDEAGFHIKIGSIDDTEARLSFCQGKDNEIAYITNEQLYITKSVVLQQMDVGQTVANGGLGQWSWKLHKNASGKNNLNLKWIG